MHNKIRFNPNEFIREKCAPIVSIFNSCFCWSHFLVLDYCIEFCWHDPGSPAIDTDLLIRVEFIDQLQINGWRMKCNSRLLPPNCRLDLYVLLLVTADRRPCHLLCRHNGPVNSIKKIRKHVRPTVVISIFVPANCKSNWSSTKMRKIENRTEHNEQWKQIKIHKFIAFRTH